MSSSPADGRTAVSPSVRDTYERLRVAALGQPIPPNDRAGLSVLLRQGMWAWARAISVAEIPVRPAPPATPRPPFSDQQRTVIQILATLAMSASRGTEVHE